MHSRAQGTRSGWTIKNGRQRIRRTLQAICYVQCVDHANFSITNTFCSRNGLDELQAMDLSTVLHKVRPLSNLLRLILCVIHDDVQAAFIFHFQSSPSEVLRSTVFLKPLEVVSKVRQDK